MEATRLEISTLTSPIRAVVSDRSAHGMTIEQALPFLRLDSTIHEDPSKPARIAGISIRVDEGVPKLVVELEYTEAKKRRDDTVPYAIERVDAAAPLAPAPLAVTRSSMWQRLTQLVAAIRS
jgi:hypothetical protein